MNQNNRFQIGRVYTIKQARLEIGFQLPKNGFINWLIENKYLLSKCEVNPVYERAKILFINSHPGGRCGKIFFSEWGVKDLKEKYQQQIENLK
jgi:hypothetical protein